MSTGKEKLTLIYQFETFLANFTPTSTNIRDFWDLYKTLSIDDLQTVFEHKITKFIRDHLINPNFEIAKFALDLFENYLSRDLLTNAQYLNIANVIIDVTFQFNTDTIEAQELWVNLVRVLQLLDAKFDKLCEAKSAQMLSILSDILKSDATTGLQKSKAFVMLQKYVQIVNLNVIKDDVFPIWRSHILPQTFNLQSDAFELATILLPWAQQIVLQQDQHWDLICSDIQSKYIPILLNYIYNKNEIYSKLWIFLIKLFTCKLHKGLPVINSLLSVVETAFKAQDTNIRKEAFYCWQGLIDCINFATQEVYTEKRIKLLLIPLKTNNCKTEELIIAKFDTWCRLLRVLHHKHIIEPYVIDAFLNFSFGPLWDTPLKSYATPGIASPGKKYTSLHFNSCVTLLQLISNEKFDTEVVNDVIAKLNFVNAKISLSNFAKISKTIIFAVGEACVLLSHLDVVERDVVNEVLWRSLFFMVDASEDRKKMIEDVTSIILAVVSMARKKTTLVTFAVVPLIKIIISNEFNCVSNENFADTFLHVFFNLVLKKDKTLLLKFDTTIFQLIFMFKRPHLNYLKFFKSVLHKNKLNTGLAVNILEPCHAFWFFLMEELKFKLSDGEPDMLELKMCFYELFTWPLLTLNAFCNEKLISMWKEMFVFYECRVSQSDLNKLLIEYATTISEQNPELLCIPEFVHFIVLSLKLQVFTIDNCDVVYDIISNLNQIISLPSLPAESAVIYQFTVMHLLENTPKLSYLPRIIAPLIDILSNIINKYNKITVIYALKSFVNSVSYSVELRPHIKKIIALMTPLEMQPIYAEHATIILKTINSKLRLDEQHSPEEETKQLLVLFGQKVDTPEKVRMVEAKDALKLSKKAVKLDADSDLVYVTTPYKFDPKKLTKTQREKLSRRRDDIPALYADLSQSQSRNFDSNSESLPATPIGPLDIPETPMTIDEGPPQLQTPEPVTAEAKPIETIDNSVKVDDVPIETLKVVIESRENTNIPEKLQRSSPSMNLDDTSKKNEQSGKHKSKTTFDTLNNPDMHRGRRRKSTLMSIDAEKPKQLRRKTDVSDATVTSVGTRTTRELKRMKMDVIDEHEYKNIDKRRTRSGILLERPSSAASPSPTPKLRHSTRISEIVAGKQPKAKDIEDIAGSETDSEPIIENTQDTSEMNLKQFKIPALYHLEGVKPGEHLAIENGNRSVDLIKGPKITSPFKVIENHPKVNNNDIQVTGARSIDLQTIPDKPSLKVDDKIEKLVQEQEDIDETMMSEEMEGDINTKKNSDNPPEKDNSTEMDKLLEKVNSPEKDNTLENTLEKEVEPVIKDDELVKKDDELVVVIDDTPLEVNDTPPKADDTSSKLDDIPPEIDDTPPKTDDTPPEIDENPLKQDETPTKDSDNMLKHTYVKLEDIKGAEELMLSLVQVPCVSETMKASEQDNRILNPDTITTNPVTPDGNVDEVIETTPKILTDNSITIDDKTETPMDADETLDISIVKPENQEVEAEIARNLNSADTESISTEALEELNANPTEAYPQNDGVCRKVILDTSDDLSVKDDFASPEASKLNDIPTSPVQLDTPTRNRELLRNTLEISPIKKQPEPSRVPEISPVLFNSEPSTAQSIGEVSKCATSSSSLRRELGSRSAQMMDLVSAKTGLNYTNPMIKKKKSAHKVKKCTYSSPSQNRIAKMMEQCERPAEKMESATEVKEEISEADIFSFSRNLPSPTASPSIGILSKRKEQEYPDDSMAPAAKRKRVNFADPPVSSRKFIEKNAKHKFSPALKQLDIIPQEPRVLRSSNSKNSQDTEPVTPENPYQIKEHLTEIADQIIKKYVNASDNIKLNPVKDYNTTDPICPALIDCVDPVMVIIPNLTTSDFIQPTFSILDSKNIKTIGDLAQRTELQVYQIPLKVETVKAVLSGYKIAVTPVKPARKIKPISFSFNDPKSCEVSVITSSSRDEAADTSVIPGEGTLESVTPEADTSGDAETVVRWNPKPEFGTDVSYLSPNSFKDSILAEEMYGTNIQNILLSIINVLNEKNYDPKPLLQILFGGISNLTNILVNMGTFKVHHLATVQNWNEIVSDIITQIGIWKLMRLLSKMNNVPQALMISALLKHTLRENGDEFVCEQLDKNEILKFIIKHFDLSQIIHEYDAHILKTTLTDLATNSKYTNLNFKDVLIDLYSNIIENPVHIGVALSKLSVLEIGEAVIQRLDSKTDLCTFMEHIYASVPPQAYLTPIPRELLAATEREPDQHNPDTQFSLEMVENGSISKEAAQHLFKCVAKMFSISELTDLFYTEVKKKM